MIEILVPERIAHLPQFLGAYFNKSEVDANSTMMEIHKLGAAIAGIYDYQIAEQKVYEVMELAKENDYPLKITGEPEDV